MKRGIALALCAGLFVLWLPILAGAASAQTEVVSAGSNAGDGAADHFTLVLSGGTTVEASVNGTVVQSIPLAGLTSLTVQGSSDDDTLTVDDSGGLIAVPGGINYDGGSGFDSLALVDNGGPTITDSRTTLGPTTGGGQNVMTSGASNQIVNYLNLEPVLSTVGATNATGTAHNAADAINYT